MRWRGIFSGALALAALQAVLSTEASANRVGGLFGVIGKASRHFLSPYEPAIPDLRKSKTPPPPPTPPPLHKPGRPKQPGTGPGNGVLA